VEELCDEDVSLDDFLLIDLLDSAQDVQQPLELFLTPRHPDEVHLNSEHTSELYHVLNGQVQVGLQVLTSSSAVAERPRDALCPSVVSFNSVIPRAQELTRALLSGVISNNLE